MKVALTNGAALDVDQVMLATGRDPNTKGLGLDKIGVSLDAMGAVKVDEYSQSTVPSIYAVGDVTNRLALTPVAIREGHAFADTVFGNKKTAVDYEGVPTAVFTTPELGTVGLTEGEAREAYHCVDIYATRFRPLKATVSGRAEMTLMKLVVDGETGPGARRPYARRRGRRKWPSSSGSRSKWAPKKPISTRPWRCTRPRPRNS